MVFNPNSFSTLLCIPLFYVPLRHSVDLFLQHSYLPPFGCVCYYRVECDFEFFTYLFKALFL
ncbi:hypothetical protein JHK84_029580 [Glycine max]|uniref:Uncharacterized protein n=1 Tax=Glycine soja TaxID=3848 RepID=A0A445ITD6_GLYSO|nr:hypothetical protein JHK84_029580 [Glycine max]RZB89309.1 hypothetical protein D0Y65_028250 [Glycine soja]